MIGMDFSGRFHGESQVVLESFLRCSPVKRSPKDKGLACGVFYAGDESDKAREWNGAISYYFENLSKVYYDALSGKITWKEAEKRIEELSKEFVQFLRGDLRRWKVAKLILKDQESKENKSLQVVSQEKKPFSIFYLGRTHFGDGVFCLYHVERDFQREIEEVLDEYQKRKEVDGIQAFADARQKLYFISLLATMTLLIGLLEVAEDQEVKAFLKFLINLIQLSLQKEDVRKYVLPRFLKLRVDPYFAFPEDESEDDLETGYLTYKPLITWLGYFPSPLSEEDVLERIGRKLFKRFKGEREELINRTREWLSTYQPLLGSDPNYWISKLYGKESEEFLKKLRKTLHAILEGKVNTVGRVAFEKDGKPINEVKERTYFLKGSKKRKLLFICDEFPQKEKKEIDKGIETVYEVLKKENNYLKTQGLIEGKEIVNFKDVFPYWEDLKREENAEKNREWKEKFLATLLQLGAWTKAIIKYGKDKGIEFITFFVLNVGGEENGGELRIWDVVRAFYNHAFPIPAQTLKKDTVMKLAKLSKELEWLSKESEKKEWLKQKKWLELVSIVKNAFLSAIYSQKVLKLRFEEELKTSVNKIYLLVENSTVRIGENSHRIYHVYSVSISKNELWIELEKTLHYFADGKGGEAGEFHRLLEKAQEENSLVLCISSDENSLVFKREGCYPVLYRERKTQISVHKKSVLGKDAYFIFEKSIQDFLRHVGHRRISEKGLEGYWLVAVKPPFNVPPKLKEELYVNSILSLFFVKNLKGESPVAQEAITYALLSWLAFLSESYAYGFVKPKFMQKKLLDVEFSRKKWEGEDFRLKQLELDSGVLITELAYLVKVSLSGEVFDESE